MARRKFKTGAIDDFDIINQRAEKLESLIHLGNNLREKERRLPVTFNEFLHMTSKNPVRMLRDIDQLFHDMLHHYVPEGVDDYQQSKHSIGFVDYDCRKLFVEGCDNPFFADRLFANRLMNFADGFRKGTYKNVIFLFEGPPGSGKSTFLNNLLQKLEDFAKTEVGTTYKVFWRLRVNEIRGFRRFDKRHPNITDAIDEIGIDKEAVAGFNGQGYSGNYIEFSCPNHDHPLLIIPKSYRPQFLDELIPDEDFKEKLFNEKQYEWVLKGIPCNICKSIYNSLLDALGDPLAVFSMLYARKNFFSRQLGEGISVFNPGDDLIEKPIDNPTLQNLINDLFQNDDIRFIYSYLAKTNSGVLALMDIKAHNVERLKNYHGIISDGVHKVDLAEEHINTLFLGLINPGDRKHYEEIPSFQDRIITVNIPYILEYNTEIAIYKNKLGEKIESLFLPRVLRNFAKIIISTRLDKDSPAIRRWIKNPEAYIKYLDRNMLLLKMDIYTGKVPNYLTDEDLKRFDRQTRKAIIDESISQGMKGFSGRQSVILLSKLIDMYADGKKLITMDNLKTFFTQEAIDQKSEIPEGFIDSIIDMYDFNVLQELKEAIYYFNEEQLSAEILDYLFALNFDVGVTKRSEYTGNTIEITEEYLDEFEAIMVGAGGDAAKRAAFRKDIFSEYITKTLSQDIKVEGKKITDTELYQNLFERYTRSLKENSLKPYIGNDNFRRAIQDYGTKDFNAYGDRLKRDVTQLITKLRAKFHYDETGARQICFYVLDRGLVNKY